MGKTNERSLQLNERQREIVKFIDKNGAARVADLSSKFHVSEETIRRDFEKLEKDKLLRKIHGGALKVDQGVETPQLHRQSKNTAEKQVIAQKAASFVENGDIIAVDASTTALMVVKHVKDKSITVITNSIGVTMELSTEDHIRVILIGGYLSKASMSLVGNFAERVIEDYHVDKFFFSCLGVDIQRGVSEMHEDQALVKKQLISISENLYLLADSSKFGEKSLFRLCDVSILDYVITDNKVSMNFIREVNKSGVSIIVGDEN
ncbi:DeoR/GlpR family DNA-binding transcription regulator [Salibacterium halotolerans]|uniref:DNA-binding transcriptional regulator of sugar metabolism, DeoR/GlpR family n=1 Tax=Salibacterium halotolerans TaxID=1884432 RepID=A0A1I5TMU1_9BACI|nr:DeoR/GlpR family DNA-binding transcription regulator [Salibacterium halotolerans]SFP83937.1 DNA-binding transcriptional regulator of sugar metabolism, DeoR/GlpR family [Salibacterium halotolerans]